MTETALLEFNTPKAVEKAVRACAATLDGFNDEFAPDIRIADPRHGDLQSNGILAFAKSRGVAPCPTAKRLVDALRQSPPLHPNHVAIDVAGPGFINFRFTADFLLAWLQRYREPADFKAASGDEYRRSRIIVDYSSPNIAKQMHVGHIRSTIIGEAICRLLEFCGANVLRDNYIGDWGTQFGLLLMEIRRRGYTFDPPPDDPLADLEALYKDGAARAKKDTTALETARQELVKLQQGDPENSHIWQQIRDLSYKAFQEVYDRFDIQFDKVLGESFYRDKVDRVYNELTEIGLARESEGALAVFFPNHPRFCKQPFLIRKSDGASNYAATDLAAVLYRCEHFKAREILYLTDSRQRDHFTQLFLTVEQWFAAKNYPLPQLRHIPFGSILGQDGKAIKTRSGDPIKLKDLLDEAVERAYTTVSEKNPDLPEPKRRRIAQTVGIGAVRYADLMQSRTGDYVFSWQKLLSLEGNTAPYLLYAVARIHSIFRKLDLNPGEGEEGAAPFQSEAELTLARKQLGFATALDQALGDLRPHFLCTYLYELAGAFSAFYTSDKVMAENTGVRARRILLCARTLTLLETGLNLLGISTLQKM